MNKEQKIISMYCDEKLSTYQIAQNLNTYPNKIRRILIKNNVQLNTKSEAQKNALAQGNSKIPTQGKKRTEEERIKISKTLKDRWSNIDKKSYEKVVEQSKARWSKMTAEEKRNMNQLAIKAIQKAGKEGSKLEKFLKQELSKVGFKVEIHKKSLIPNENLEIDLYIPSVKTIIEIDGPSHFFPIWGEEKLQKQIKADQNKTGLILSKGFAIIRVKHLSDSICLIDQHKLKDKLIDMLHEFEGKFPSKSKRYIEIET
jgi:very-short-patch-repair endonuclease